MANSKSRRIKKKTPARSKNTDSELEKMLRHMDAQFALVGSQFAQLSAAMETNFSKWFRTRALYEAGRARNIAALERYGQILRQQHEILEKRLTRIENSSLK